jgi:hypothetical protein
MTFAEAIHPMTRRLNAGRSMSSHDKQATRYASVVVTCKDFVKVNFEIDPDGGDHGPCGF